jgi:hypothetical protein
MASLGLPTNKDATYADSGTDASVKEHQQEHDKVHTFVNLFDAEPIANVTPVNGEVLYGVGGLWSRAVFEALTNARLIQAIQGGQGIDVIPDTAGEGVTITSTAADMGDVIYGGNAASLAGG